MADGMSHSRDAAEALRLRPALRGSWIERLVALAEADHRIAALWAVGSLAFGEADDWSDIDIIVSCQPETIEERRTLARAAGSVLLEWDAPQNAAPGSMHYCTVYDFGPLPFGVDWHLRAKRLPPFDAVSDL